MRQYVGMVSAKGYNGSVSFDGRTVRIDRVGFVARATQGGSSKVIPVGQLSGVQWKRAGFGVRGYLEFTLAGGVEARSRPMGGRSQNVRNENAVVFSRRHQGSMRVVYEAVLAAL